MKEQKLIIDADILSYILKKDKKVEKKLEDTIIRYNPEIYLSPMVYYQVKRGLLDKKATRQLSYFDKFARTIKWLDFEIEDWNIAISLYLYLKRSGYSPKHQDGDILIAAQAERIGAVIITNNIKDFKRLGVKCETWR